MVVVDTSVWIDYLRGANSRQVEILEETLDSNRIVIGDLLITELLQGFKFKRDLSKVQELIDCLEYEDMLGREIAEKSAENYRFLKKKGFTVRKTIDVMIATFCIEKGYWLLHNDRDFNPIEKHLKLKVLS